MASENKASNKKAGKCSGLSRAGFSAAVGEQRTFSNSCVVGQRRERGGGK